MQYKLFELTPNQYTKLAEDIRDNILLGLEKDGQEIKCLPTYCKPAKTPNKGKVLALDLGGTNFRAAVVEYKEGAICIQPENGYSLNVFEYMTKEGSSRETLFSKLTEIVDTLDLNGIAHIGYCFSYPAESIPNNGQGNSDARLLKWTKGINVEGMVGELIGQTLLDYLNRNSKNANFETIKVINDTVASLFAGYTQPNYDAYIGLIVGTGTNMAAFVRSDKIQKLDPHYKNEGIIPVNLESGNFSPHYLTLYDDKLDEESANKGEQRFEKAVSGAYLGKLFRHVFPQDIIKEDFDTKELNHIMNNPDKYTADYTYTACAIYTRSAKLTASALAGLISVLAGHNASIQRINVTAEGSLFWSKYASGKDYHEIVSEELHSLLAKLGMNKIQVNISQINSANLRGAALAALS